MGSLLGIGIAAAVLATGVYFAARLSGFAPGGKDAAPDPFRPTKDPLDHPPDESVSRTPVLTLEVRF